MATRVGKEKDLLHLLNNLIEIDYDAIEAYESAIDRLLDAADKEQLRIFMGDHQRHVRDLSDIVRDLGGEPPKEAGLKRFLTKGKVVIASLAGDLAVLEAMRSNEEDTNTAYERACSQDGLPKDVFIVLERNLADERRHRAFLLQRIDALKASHEVYPEGPLP